MSASPVALSCNKAEFFSTLLPIFRDCGNNMSACRVFGIPCRFSSVTRIPLAATWLHLLIYLALRQRD